MGRDHERTVEACHRLVALYEAWGKPSKADAFRSRTAAVTPVTPVTPTPAAP